jgi:hypothetical protein
MEIGSPRFLAWSGNMAMFCGGGELANYLPTDRPGGAIFCDI